MEQQRKQGNEASLALTKLESELESQWRLKCDKMVSDTRQQLEQQLRTANQRADQLQLEVRSLLGSQL